MKNIIIVLSVLAFVGATSGCGSRRQTTTTTRETIRSVPADPVVVEKRTTTETEIRTSDELQPPRPPL